MSEWIILHDIPDPWEQIRPYYFRPWPTEYIDQPYGIGKEVEGSAYSGDTLWPGDVIVGYREQIYGLEYEDDEDSWGWVWMNYLFPCSAFGRCILCGRTGPIGASKPIMTRFLPDVPKFGRKWSTTLPIFV